MLDCAKQKGPCSYKPPKLPVCPQPPPKPFPWIYPLVLASILTFLGLFYKYFLWRESREYLKPPGWRPRVKTKTPIHDEDLPACVQYLIIGTGAAGWAAYNAIMKHDPLAKYLIIGTGAAGWAAYNAIMKHDPLAKYLIIGTGAAGWAAYNAIMKHDPLAKVFFITDEDSYPYMRPPMSKWMWWNGNPPDLRNLNYVNKELQRKTMYYAPCKAFMDPVRFFRTPKGPALGIAMGWCVKRIDADEHRAWINTYCGERPMYYERALIAVGARPKTLSFYKTSPKFVRDRITTIRKIRDLEIAYRKVREAKHVTVVGGGYLGSEISWFMGRMHENWNPAAPEDYVPPQILHVFKGKGILSSIIPEYLGEWAAEKLKCQNVSIMPNTLVYDAFEKDGRLQLTLSNGQSIITDYILVAIGTEPREDIGRKSFLEMDEINGGFSVNTELQARKHLYVAGDAASVYTEWKNKRIRMESYLSAEEQGTLAGTNMTGYWIPYNREPHFWFELPGDISMELVGEVGACMPTVGLFKPCDEIEDAEGRRFEEEQGEFQRPCFKESESYRNRYKRGMMFYLRDDIVVGMVFWNFPPIEDRYEVVCEMLRARPSYKDINMLAELLGFPDIQCVYLPEDYGKEVKSEDVCIDKNVSNWLSYEEHEKQGSLSKVETPETVMHKNAPL
ncbi:pyridine nucleotide-disulfide oxidoreductase domain-containing protein [Phthorimaea operculella]|nr:pyridine nucleotide-disulfide oxidoreductase domain-containing protein [Phthorimaea operculella]